MTVTQLREGDYRPDGAGGFALATGGAGVLERVLFLLTARRGGFPLLPEVGSRLYLLSRARPSARGALGASYAAEALAGEENLRVLGAVWTEETRTLTVELEWQGEPMQAVLDAAALDQVAEQVALLQREMNLYTAQAEGLTGLLELLGLERAGETLEELRQTVAALLRIGGDSFTLAAMNDTLRGCGIPAQVEETEDPLEVVVSFPGVEGIPAGFEQTKARIEEILPCHLLVKYQFSDSV